MVNVIDLADTRVGLKRRLVDGQSVALSHLLAVFKKTRCQFREVVDGCSGPRKLFAIERQASIDMMNRYERLLESPFLDGCFSTTLTVHGQLIALLTAESFDGRDEVG